MRSGKAGVGFGTLRRLRQYLFIVFAVWNFWVGEKSGCVAGGCTGCGWRSRTNQEEQCLREVER
jgi:hypothetical protein